MPRPNRNRRSVSPNSAYRGRAKRTYLFAVAALAALLVGIIFCSSSVKGYVAKATVVLVSAADDAGGAAALPSIETVRQVVTDPDFFRDAFSATDDSADPAAGRAVPPVPARLRLTAAGDRSATQRQLELAYIGRSAAEAVSVLDQVARHFVVSFPARQVRIDRSEAARKRSRNSAIRQFERAAAEERAAWAALDRFVQKHFATLQDAADPASDAADPRLKHASPVGPNSGRPAGEVPAASGGPPARSGNQLRATPDQLRLRRQLNELIGGYDRLLERRTPEHPEVRQLALEIQRLEQELARASQSADNADRRSADDPNRHEARDNRPKDGTAETDRRIAQAGPKAVPLAAAIDQYGNLKQRYEASAARRDAAGAALLRTSDPARRLLLVHAAIVRPAHLAGRLGGNLPVGRLALLTILALGFGAAVAWLAGPAAGDVFATAGQVEAELGLPVAGMICTGDQPSAPRFWLQRLRWARRLTLACELVLVAIVLLVLLVAVCDSPLSARFASDPFGTISQAVSRAVAFRFGTSI